MATTILNDAWAPMEDLKTFDPKGYNPGVWERLSNFPDETGRAKSGNWSLSSDWKKKNSLESPKSTNSISSAKNKAKKQQKSN